MNKWWWIAVIAIALLIAGYMITNRGEDTSSDDNTNPNSDEPQQDSFGELQDSDDDFDALDTAIDNLD